MARAMDLPKQIIKLLYRAALLANTGRLYLPREIPARHEPLTDQEQQLLQRQAVHTVDILKATDIGRSLIAITRQKNERPDDAFDRNVTAALFHVAEGQSGPENWQSVQLSD